MFIRSGYSAQTRSEAPVSDTEQHHRATDVVPARRDARPTRLTHSHRSCLSLQLRRVEAIELDHVVLHRAPPVGGHGLPTTLQRETVTLGADRRRVARIHDAVELADVRKRDWRVLGHLK